MKTNRKRFRIVVGLALLAVSVVAGHVNGSFPVGTLCALCPAGFFQLIAASKSIPWGLLPGVVAVLLATLLLGRFFCSWACPSQLLKNVFGGRRPRGVIGRSGVSADKKSAGCACGTDLKSQALVFGALLLVSFVVGFPVFCLFCPIGLVFGTLWALNRVFVLLQPGWELVAFPLMLAVELFFFKRWCAAVCPLGFAFALVGKLRGKLRFGLRPRSHCALCESNAGCSACSRSCPEDIEVFENDKSVLESCTMCLDCVENCPTKAISLGVKRVDGRCDLPDISSR